MAWGQRKVSSQFRKSTPNTKRGKAELQSLEIRRLLAAGGLDATFNGIGKRVDDTGLDDFARATLVTPGGKIVVAGEAGGQFALSEYSSAGGDEGAGVVG